MGVWIFLQSCCSVGVALWGGDMGGYPLHGTGTRGVTGPGGADTGGADLLAAGRR